MIKLFDFDDILIQPETITMINSRNEVNPNYKGGYFPLMTAPMDTVICEKNKQLYKNCGIIPVLPRTKEITKIWDGDMVFLSYSIEDFNNIFILNNLPEDDKIYYALIDVDNGHMSKVIELSKLSKEKYGDKLVLMVGNIANPSTFGVLTSFNVDYVRIGIGNGCLTTVQTGVGYPMGSLINECNKIKIRNLSSKTKIVADGGFKKYSDIIKGLALGADFIMIGSMFNKSLESSGETTDEHGDIFDQYDSKTRDMFDVDIPLYKTFRGMSTKEVQQSWGKIDLTTSEGIVKKQRVEYTLCGWVANFESYLKSAMSYTNKKELPQFIGGVHYNFITQNAFKRFDK